MPQSSQSPRRSRSTPKPLGVFPFSLERANSAGFLKRQLLRFFPVHFVKTVGFEQRNAWLRVLAPLRARRFRGQKNLLVQVGCDPLGWPLVDGADRWFKHQYHTPMELLNAVFRQGPEHHFAYDAETLEFVLRHAGFENVTQRSFGVSADPVICLDIPERATESLYMEAVK